MKITTFKDFQKEAKDWMEIKCEIEWTPIEWKITIEDWDIYICQDEKYWGNCKDKKWYKYSWVIDDNYDFAELLDVELYRKVYVSDTSIEDALEKKKDRILLAELPWKADYKYIVVQYWDEEKFLKWNKYNTSKYNYIAEIPTEEIEEKEEAIEIKSWDKTYKLNLEKAKELWLIKEEWN